jgi:hypothetical protein
MCSGKELSHAPFEPIGASHCKKNAPKTYSPTVWKLYSLYQSCAVLVSVTFYCNSENRGQGSMCHVHKLYKTYDPYTSECVSYSRHRFHLTVTSVLPIQRQICHVCY